MTPDVPMRSEDYAAGYADGVASLRMIRCLKHRGVLPYNANEIGGGECAVCEIDAKNAEIRGLVNQKWVRKEDHDALRSDCERMRKLLRSLLNPVNAVTAHHRHGSLIPNSRLNDLVNRQIEVEEQLSRLDAAAKEVPRG